MIDARELRIGNLVEWNKEEFIVRTIYKDAIENNLWCKPLNEIHPIALTEEWLSKFGFILREQSLPEKCYKTKEGICLFIRDDRYQLRQLIKTNMGFVSSVHQLQNLYFALTGEELTIKA